MNAVGGFREGEEQSLTGEEEELYDQYVEEYLKLVRLEPERSEEINEELEVNQEARHEILRSIECRKRELKSNRGSVCSTMQTKTSRTSSTRSSEQRRIKEAVAKLARLKKEMEYHDTLVEAEAALAKDKAEAEAALAKDKAEAEAALAKDKAEAEAALARDKAEAEAALARDKAEAVMQRQ
ncbi:hypothetical protein E2C01_069913 [Portunus trituberculatus]|uniref:Uncharacterized protein n=1 Tax=Portunus trituberculatus TaxID=210409 RepID=A0A5B7HZU6_PORTR|nr:hypothetical protein [Portunus trituberculatus]